MLTYAAYAKNGKPFNYIQLAGMLPISFLAFNLLTGRKLGPKRGLFFFWLLASGRQWAKPIAVFDVAVAISSWFRKPRIAQQASWHVDSSALGDLNFRKHGFTLVDKVYYLKEKLSISPFIKILELQHVHIVHMASISYWSGVFSSVVLSTLGGELQLV